MKNYQKENVLRMIKDLEDKIETCKINVKSFTDDAMRWNGAETASTYACRLNGYIHELNGIFSALTTMGYEIKCDKNGKVIDFFECDEDDIPQLL